MQFKSRSSEMSGAASLRASKTAAECYPRWQNLCKVYLPVKSDGIFWRFSRRTRPEDPLQGWKLHISATLPQACDLFEKVAPFLASKNLRFKAPGSLKELIKINAGLDYGYWQVGKFLTVYPSAETEVVELARELHDLTREFISIAVPFDNQYLPNSSVFYRYGAFEEIELVTDEGLTLPAVRNLSGKLVFDDCLQAVPEWLNDPFPPAAGFVEDDSKTVETPLMTTYKVFRAITQRGKGGTYQALDLSTNPPRFCIVKEGRRHGEVSWNGQDGYQLAKNEKMVLQAIGENYKGIPKYFASFEAFENLYLVMEYVEGKSLADLMKYRKRRFFICQVIFYAVEIAKIIEEIHTAGWIWNDCKPSNLIVTNNKSLRPIDFEGAYPINQTPPFDWRSDAFSKPGKYQSSSEAADLYSLGAVIYFLLTGRFYNSNAAIPIDKLRRKVPGQLRNIIENLLETSGDEKNTASDIREKFEKIQKSN